MSSKRLSTDEPIYHPKKRALFEHKRQSELLKYETVKSCHGSVESGCKNDFMALKMKLECSQRDIVCMRPRSDSVHSLHSLMSDTSESVSTLSRESSPNMDLFDSRTPERNPTTSLNPDISKPLFPVGCEADISLTGKDGNSPDLMSHNHKNDKREESDPHTQSDVSKHGFTDIQQTGALKRTNYRQESMYQSDSCVDNDNTHVYRPYLNKEEKHKKPNPSYLQFNGPGGHEGSTGRYVGPMVSLLSRFNKEAVKDHINSENSRHHVNSEHVQGEKACTTDTCIKNLSEEAASIEGSIKDNSHNTLISDLKVYKCRICSKDFKAQDQLKSHMKEDHSGPLPYKCEHCPRAFSQYNNLQRHLRVHRAKIFKCKLCDREFNEEFYLNMHMGTHTGKRVYSCGVCSASFTSNQDLKIHVKTHSPSQLHTCDVCGKSFSKACVLRQHKKGHSGERPHKCDKCPKTFIHRHHLTMHLKSHSEEKQYSCDICKKEFYQSSHLYKHLKAHEEVSEVSKEIVDKMGLTTETSTVVPGVDKENKSNKRSNNLNKGRNPSKASKNDSIGFSKTDMYNSTQKLPPLSEAFVLNQENHAIVPEHQSNLQSQALKPSIPYSHPNILTQSLYHNLAGSHSYQNWYPTYHSHLQVYYNNLYMMRNQANTAVQGPGIYEQTQFPVNSLCNTSDRASYHNISGTNTDETVHKSVLEKDAPGKDCIENTMLKGTKNETANTSKPELNSKVDQLKNRPLESFGTYQPEGKNLSFMKTVEAVVTKSNKNSAVLPRNDKPVDSAANSPQNCDGINRNPMASSESKSPVGNSKSDPMLSLNSWINVTEASQAQTVSNQELFTNKPPLTLDSTSSYYLNRPSYPVNQQYMYPYMNSHQLVSLNPFLMKSRPLTGISRAEQQTNTTQMASNSPKKRHFSSQDVYMIKKPLRNEESQVTNRQRHLSECPQVNISTSDTSAVSLVESHYELSRTESCKVVNHAVKQEDKVNRYQESINPCDFIGEFSSVNQNSDTAESIKLLGKDKVDFDKENLDETHCKGVENEELAVERAEGTIRTHVDDDKSEDGNGFRYVKIRQIDSVCDDRGIPEASDSNGPLDLSLREHESIVDDGQLDIDNDRVVSQGNIGQKAIATDLKMEKPPMNVNSDKTKTEAKSSVTGKGMKSDLSNVCGLCWMKFDSAAEFENHQIEHAQKLDKSSKCNYCDKVFMRPFDLQCHLLKHKNSDLNYPKLEQSGSSLSKTNFGALQSISKPDIQTELVESTERNQSNTALWNAQQGRTYPFVGESSDSKMQVELTVYKCDICMREFSHKHNLTRHRMSHSEKSYECSTCKRTFKEKFYLQMHAKTHVEEKTKTCEICGANVPKTNLWKHTNEHLSNIIQNPTYKQIGCRVDEIIQGKSVKHKLITDSQTRQVLGERKENMMSSGNNFSTVTERRKSFNTDVDDFENNPNLVQKKDLDKDISRFNNCNKSLRDAFRLKN